MSNNNIPTVTINEMINELCELYEAASEVPGGVAGLPSAYLQGPPGVGKSQGVHQIAKRLEECAGKKVVVTEVRLLLLSPIDLRGVPAKVEMEKEKEYCTQWLKPAIFRMDESKDCINILYLGELSACAPAMQAAGYQIVLEKCIGEHKLPDNCIVIADGNRLIDHSVVHRMPKALANKMLHYEVISEFESWKAWAIENGINDKVLAYLSYDKSNLFQEEVGLDEPAYKTPRTWEFVSKIMNLLPHKSPEQLFHKISSAVGVSNALDFVEFCKLSNNLPHKEEILRGTCMNYPKTPDALHFVISALTVEIKKREDEITVTELENCCSYAKRFPMDYASLFYHNLMDIPKLRMKLLECPSMVQWNRKYGYLF